MLIPWNDQIRRHSDWNLVISCRCNRYGMNILVRTLAQAQGADQGSISVISQGNCIGKSLSMPR